MLSSEKRKPRALGFLKSKCQSLVLAFQRTRPGLGKGGTGRVIKAGSPSLSGDGSRLQNAQPAAAGGFLQPQAQGQAEVEPDVSAALAAATAGTARPGRAFWHLRSGPGPLRSAPRFRSWSAAPVCTVTRPRGLGSCSFGEGERAGARTTRTPRPGGRRGAARGARGGAARPFKPFWAAGGDSATRGPGWARRRGAARR